MYVIYYIFFKTYCSVRFNNKQDQASSPEERTVIKSSPFLCLMGYSEKC